MSEITCPTCATLNPHGAAFCANCGAALLGDSGPLKVGQMMHGRYTVLRPLGKGGMGALHLASETIAGQDRLVVIKEMLDYYDPADPHGETKALKRFETEAATLARLNTAGIPQLFDYFREGGRNYIVMQYIQGQNLESGLTHQDDHGNLVPGKAYPVEQVRRWGLQLCKVLENLAGQNVVHMDIKPANLIVSEAGDVWLVDFGTAKAQRSIHPGGAVGLEKSSVYGTQGYAPPEQVAGNAEPRSDIYALAATLYHLLTDDDPRINPFAFARLDQLPQDIKLALKSALSFEVNQRCTARQFAALLEKDTGPLTNTVFRWQDGTLANQPKELAVSANRNWEEARGYFVGDAWNKWFKDLHRYDLVGQIQQVKSQHKDPDLALDAFLRSLDPTLDPPGLLLPVAILDAGVIPWQKQSTLELDIFNLGGGVLQARFIELPAGVKVSPEQFVTHEWQRVKISLDTGELSPGPKQQTLFIGIDAGIAGKKFIPITITIPEPKLRVDRSQIDLGTIGRGETALGSLRVSNSGGSSFIVEAAVQPGWPRLDPARFLCAPGKNYLVKIKASSHDLKAGENIAQISLRARAGNWSQMTKVPVRLVLQQEKIWQIDWTPSLGGALIMVFYGGILGIFLGFMTAYTFQGITTTLGAALAGAVIGMFISLLPSAIAGAVGRVSSQAGRQGLRAGLRSGVALGMLVGALAGAAFEWILSGLGLALVSGEGLNLFGALVGATVGLALASLIGWQGRR